MKRTKGNTVILKIDTGQDLRDANSISVTFSQKGKVILTKTGESVMAEEDHILVLLSQADTEMFLPGRYVPAEVTAYYDEGTKVTSNVMYRPFNGTLKGELS